MIGMTRCRFVLAWAVIVLVPGRFVFAPPRLVLVPAWFMFMPGLIALKWQKSGHFARVHGGHGARQESAEEKFLNIISKSADFA
jgi:hypothetical protein